MIPSTKDYNESIGELKHALDEADAVSKLPEQVSIPLNKSELLLLKFNNPINSKKAIQKKKNSFISNFIFSSFNFFI